MSKSRKVPKDLMGAILGESSVSSSHERTSSWPTRSRSADRTTAASASTDEGTIFWEKQLERVGTTFNLSKQVNRELDKLRLELQLEEGVRSSNSEIAEIALRIAIEDAREKGRESELVKRLSGRPADQAEEAIGGRPDAPGGVAEEVGWTARRSVEDSGRIVETTYNEDGEITDEREVGVVTDLPVEAEYLDEEGRFLSLANDELGNTFEWVTDDAFNTLGARLVRGAD
ncbi:MAG: hypothetical protein M3259_04970 [Actinomycetota bacterium]|nr:hypothetical protein [Actinomycetota bacterium]